MSEKRVFEQIKSLFTADKSKNKTEEAPAPRPLPSAALSDEELTEKPYFSDLSSPYADVDFLAGDDYYPANRHAAANDAYYEDEPYYHDYRPQAEVPPPEKAVSPEAVAPPEALPPEAVAPPEDPVPPPEPAILKKRVGHDDPAFDDYSEEEFRFTSMSNAMIKRCYIKSLVSIFLIILLSISAAFILHLIAENKESSSEALKVETGSLKTVQEEEMRAAAARKAAYEKRREADLAERQAQRENEGFFDAGDEGADTGEVKEIIDDAGGEKIRYEKKENKKSAEKEYPYSYYIDDETFLVKPLPVSETGASEEADARVVLLTFDDAPEEYALEIAENCDRSGVKAIFFINGHFVETPEDQNKLKQLHEMGFTIGNHSYSHPKLTDMTYEEQRDEIVKLNDLVEEVTGERPRFFRPPFGMYNKDTLQICEEEGMMLMTWTYGYDWQPEYCEADALAKIMVDNEYITDGANLLMHDRRWTCEAMPEIIRKFREKGYGCVDPRDIKIR